MLYVSNLMKFLSTIQTYSKVRVSSALFWNITQHTVVIPYDVSKQTIRPICKGQETEFLAFAEGADRLFRNVGKELPLYAA